MRGIRLGVLVLAVFLMTWTLPTGLADSQELPHCEEVTEEVNGFEGYYVRTEGETVEVWEEDNDLPDLQTEACYTGDDPESGETHDGDVLEATLPADAVEDAEEAVGVLLDIVPDPVELCQSIVNHVPGHHTCAF